MKIEEKLEENNILKAISIEDKMLKIQNLLKKLNNLNFSNLLEDNITKIDIIVSFLVHVRINEATNSGREAEKFNLK